MRHERRADPVARAGAAVPDPRRDLILLGLGRQVGGRAAAAEEAPGRGDDLVIARCARAVGRGVRAPGLALHDRPWDRPRPAGAGARVARTARLELGDARLEALAAGPGVAEGRGARRARGGVVRLATREGGADAGQRLAAGGDRLGRLLLRRLRLREPRDRRVRVAARPLDVRDHPAVLLLDALQERRLVEQVGEVVRAEHDAQQVRVRRLVQLDEAGGEDGLALAQVRLEPLDPGALSAEVAAQGAELRLVLRELGLDLAPAAL